MEHCAALGGSPGPVDTSPMGVTQIDGRGSDPPKTQGTG